MPAFDPRDLLKTLTPDQIMALVDALTIHDPLVTANEAADYLGIAPSTLTTWIRNEMGPPVIRLPRPRGNTDTTLRFRMSVLRAWLLAFEDRSQNHHAPRPKGRPLRTPVEHVVRGMED